MASLGPGFFQKSKVALEIEKPQFVKKSYDETEGYKLKVGVKNKGSGICLNIRARFDIKDSEGNVPELLNVRVDVTNGKEAVNVMEEPMRPIEYAWVDKDERVLKTLKELKKDDVFSILFPYERFFAGIGSSTSSSEYLLKLQAKKDYAVEIEVEGEDSDRNVVIKSKKFRMQI